MTAFLQAKLINRAAGAPVIAPWEVADLPEEWLLAAEVLMNDVPAIQRGYSQVEEKLEKWRAEHRRRNG